MVPEPAGVYPENLFQKAVVSLVEDILSVAGRRFILAEGFGLDVSVFFERSSTESTIRLLEVKAFGAQRMGGVGFGNGQGKGSQVDLLLCTEETLPLLDGTVRWVYADATLPPGSARYALFNCAVAKMLAMGGVARGKQNNLRISGLRNRLVDWNSLRHELEEFLLS